MTDLWGNFDPRAEAKRIQERVSDPANPAKPAKTGAGISRFSHFSHPSPRPGDPWPPEEWQYLYGERVGFLQNDCHLSRLEAEQRALHDLEAQWLALNPPAPSDPQDGCVQCRKGVGATDLLPRLACNRSHLWLHQTCWPEYEKARRAEARAALVKMIPDLRRDPLEELLAGEPT
jgi:hypothetical protein